jgi:hypothetical protein
MKMKNKFYMTDDYVKEVEHYLYNDIPLSDHPIYKEINTTLDHKYLKSILLPDEKYKQLKGERDHVIYTNKGRFINTRKYRQYKPTLTTINVHIYVQRQKQNVPELFENNGWEFDIKQIFDNYKTNNWMFEFGSKWWN